MFLTKRGGPFAETHVLHDGLHPALEALGMPVAGMHSFRRGCNRRWEVAGLNPAVLRQQMGHSSEAMTARYTGEIPIGQVCAASSSKTGNKIVVLEDMENGVSSVSALNSVAGDGNRTNTIGQNKALLPVSQFN